MADRAGVSRLGRRELRHRDLLASLSLSASRERRGRAGRGVWRDGQSRGHASGWWMV